MQENKKKIDQKIKEESIKQENIPVTEENIEVNKDEGMNLTKDKTFCDEASAAAIDYHRHS